MIKYLFPNSSKMNKSKYNINKTDKELVDLIIKIRKHFSVVDFSEFCNIIITRATICWQNGLEDYAFGKKEYDDYQSVKTVLEILNINKKTGSYDYDYVLYIKESICLYYNLNLRKYKLKRILKKNY